MSDHDTHWSEKAEWMREKGAVEAAWSTEGHLVHLKLGPAPFTGESDHPAKQLSPQERERREREQRRDIALRSSGGPVRRLSEPE